MANEQNNQHKLEFELSPEVAQGQYANLAIIAHSASEFILDFAAMLPGLQKAKVKSRIVTTPEHAKKLMLSLQENNSLYLQPDALEKTNIARYERTFGQINLSKPSHNNPMSGGGFA